MSRPDMLMVLSPVAGQTCYCVAHIVLARLARGGRYGPLMAGCAVGFIVQAALTLLSHPEPAASVLDLAAFLLVNTLTYLAFSFGYFNFVNLNIASLRIRMLQELRDAGGEAGVSELDLMSRYDTLSVVKLRLERLVRGGHLIERDGRLYTGKKHFLALGYLFNAIRWFILGSASRPASAVSNPESQKAS